MPCLESLVYNSGEIGPFAVVKICALPRGHEGDHEDEGWKWTSAPQ